MADQALIDILRDITRKVEAGEITGIYLGVAFTSGEFGSLVAVTPECDILALLGHQVIVQRKLESNIQLEPPICSQDLSDDELVKHGNVVDISGLFRTKG